MSGAGARPRPVELVFDLEGADASRLYRGGHDGPFVRLLGVQGAGGPVVASGGALAHAVHVLQDPDATRIGHNILAFDIPALSRHCGADYAALADGAVDTLVAARLADPPAAGHAKPWSAKGYYSLDSVAQRLGVSSVREKSKGTLADLVAEYGGYDKIPVDNPEYRQYLRDDLVETRAVYEALRAVIESPYARREMRVVAVQNRMTFNGWRVDTALLEERVVGERRRQAEALEELHGLGLPRTGGKSPLASNAGKEWFAAGLERLGVPVPMTKNGNVSISGDNVKELKAAHGGRHPVLDRVLDAVLLVAGVSAKYQEIQDHLIGDRVHGGIGQDQASGRWAMTKPSLTNLGKRGGKHVQRAPFLPEPGHVHMTFDLDQVDMRAIAALSQDPAYMELFGPGRDAHAEIAERVFGDRGRREEAKPCGHGWNYGQGPGGMQRHTGLPLEVCQQFDREMLNAFPVLCERREEWRDIGASGALLDNGFGRMMRCTPARAYTQAPALMGQGAARDIMCEGLLRLDPQIHPMLRAVVHDEIVLSIPERHLEEVKHHVLEALTWTWRGVKITAGASKSGRNWAQCYEK